MFLLHIYDEIITNKAPTFAMSLPLATVQTTARNVLKARIQQDCEQKNWEHEQNYEAEKARLLAKQGRKIVELTEHEKLLNGEKMPKFFEIALNKMKPLDWQTEFDKAVKAFDSNGFILLIDDEQILDLDAPLQIKVDNTSKLTFLQLIPLQGG